MAEPQPAPSSDAGSDDPFGSTHWSLVLAAGHDGTIARNALETLCRNYWFPVYGYIRRRARDTHDAEDLTQAFFAKVLEKQTIAAADRNRGRFRAFLFGLWFRLVSVQVVLDARAKFIGPSLFDTDPPRRCRPDGNRSVGFERTLPTFSDDGVE